MILNLKNPIEIQNYFKSFNGELSESDLSSIRRRLSDLDIAEYFYTYTLNAINLNFDSKKEFLIELCEGRPYALNQITKSITEHGEVKIEFIMNINYSIPEKLIDGIDGRLVLKNSKGKIVHRFKNFVFNGVLNIKSAKLYILLNTFAHTDLHDTFFTEEDFLDNLYNYSPNYYLKNMLICDIVNRDEGFTKLETHSDLITTYRDTENYYDGKLDDLNEDDVYLHSGKLNNLALYSDEDIEYNKIKVEDILYKIR